MIVSFGDRATEDLYHGRPTARLRRFPREVVDAARADMHDMTSDTVHSSFLPALRVDGGASASDLLMQMTADALGVPVLRPAHQETTSRGAALAAGVGAGLWGVERVFQREGEGDGWTRFEPCTGRARIDRRYRRWQVAVERALGLDGLDESE